MENENKRNKNMGGFVFLMLYFVTQLCAVLCVYSFTVVVDFAVNKRLRMERAQQKKNEQREKPKSFLEVADPKTLCNFADLAVPLGQSTPKVLVASPTLQLPASEAPVQVAAETLPPAGKAASPSTAAEANEDDDKESNDVTSATPVEPRTPRSSSLIPMLTPGKHREFNMAIESCDDDEDDDEATNGAHTNPVRAFSSIFGCFHNGQFPACTCASYQKQLHVGRSMSPMWHLCISFSVSSFRMPHHICTRAFATYVSNVVFACSRVLASSIHPVASCIR